MIINDNINKGWIFKAILITMSEFNKTLTEVFQLLKEVEEGKRETTEVASIKHYIIEHLKGIDEEFEIEHKVDSLLNQYRELLKEALTLVNQGRNTEACEKITKAYSLVLEMEFDLKKAYGDTHRFLQ